MLLKAIKSKKKLTCWLFFTATIRIIYFMDKEPRLCQNYLIFFILANLILNINFYLSNYFYLSFVEPSTELLYIFRYFFYKNFAFTLCHFWYAFFCGFSAQVIRDFLIFKSGSFSVFHFLRIIFFSFFVIINSVKSIAVYKFWLFSIHIFDS